MMRYPCRNRVAEKAKTAETEIMVILVLLVFIRTKKQYRIMLIDQTYRTRPFPIIQDAQLKDYQKITNFVFVRIGRV